MSSDCSITTMTTWPSIFQLSVAMSATEYNPGLTIGFVELNVLLNDLVSAECVHTAF